jgi:oligopeptide/dipeptide ABC transporter ATP-binding protein
LQSGAEGFPLRDVSFEVREREIVGVLGESGAGKSTLGLALMQVLPDNFRRMSGEIELNETKLTGLNEEGLRRLRGSEMSLLYQDASVLNPYLRVGHQVAEVLRAHHDWGTRTCTERAAETFHWVGLDERMFLSYPHQLSGGQKQRVCIALAVVCEPRLVIADEPTASLDPSTASEILELLLRLKNQRGTSFVLISHHPNVLAHMADRLLVMYAGEIIESGPTAEVLENSLHPYTRGLLRCISSEADRRWPYIPGNPPDLTEAEEGCSFEPRCPDRMEQCTSCRPALVTIGERQVRCVEYGGLY